MWSLTNKLINKASNVTSFTYPLVSQVIFFIVKINYLVMSDWFIADNVVVTNSCANATNAKQMNPNRPNSIEKVTNSSINGTKSIAKMMNSTCVVLL